MDYLKILSKIYFWTIFLFGIYLIIAAGILLFIQFYGGVLMVYDPYFGLAGSFELTTKFQGIALAYLMSTFSILCKLRWGRK